MPTINISATRTKDKITITLSENITETPYFRTYDCQVNRDDSVLLPNDLNGPTQNILRAVAIKFNHPNNYAGDA